MIATHDLRQNESVTDPVQGLAGDKEVIDPPADVARPGIGRHRPPRILFWQVWMKVSERINITCFHDPINPGSFFGQKAGGVLVCPGMGQVDFLVRRVDITAENDCLALGA